MLNLLILLVAILWPTPAQAQSFPKPPDVPAYVTVTPQWPSGTTAVRVQTPSDTPPANSYELADIPSPNRSELIKPDTTFCTVIGFGGSCHEAKFRSHLEPTHILFDDPIRNYGLPGTSHCHLFFGNSRVNAYSTFASLRQGARQYSKASGGGLNGTGYWMPCMMWPNAFGDGKDYAVLPGAITLYYAEQPLNNTQLKDLLLGLRYVSGFWMDDGGDYMTSVIAAANAAAGFNRYQAYYPFFDGSSVIGGAQHGWSCLGATPTGRFNSFVNADGSDPWNGTCTSDKLLNLLFVGAGCWDGVNLWSPGGYKHLIPEIWDSQYSKPVCPENYYRLPSLQLNFSFKHSGWDTSIKYWRLSSDNIAIGANTGTVAGKTIRRGETFHTDWFNGWDKTTLREWLQFCIGVRGNTPHECNSSTINATERMIGTADANPQTGKNPQVNLGMQPANNSPSNMWLLPSSSNGPKTIHVH